MTVRPLSAILLAHEAPDFPDVQESWFQRVLQHDTNCHKFVILGRFDQLILTLSEDPSALLPAASDITNARAATSSAYIGRVIAPNDFDPVKWADTHPVLGLCSVRFARRTLAAAGDFTFLDTFLRQRLAGRQIQYAVVSATGWEDALVLFFAKNFNVIADAAGQLRSMRINDLPEIARRLLLNDGFTHPCLTTCTLPAFCCQWTKGWHDEDTTALLSRIEADAPLNWAVRLELHPGHWKGCADDLRRRCRDLGLPEPICRPTFGQTDLRVSDSGGRDATHGGLMRFLLDVIFKVGETNTVIRSAETHLHPVIEAYAEDDAAGPQTDQRPKRKITRLDATRDKWKARLRDAAVPTHTLGVLDEMLNRIRGISEDPMHGEEFETLNRLQNAFIRAVGRLPANLSENSSRRLQEDISEWQGLVDRCLADRFRGPYPVGDSLMMRMSSYQGAHHRFLVVADYFAQQAFEMARHEIRSLDASCDIKDTALATFIGNSPSAYATVGTIDKLGCGFTDVPATLICRLRDSHLIIHETGHHIVRAFEAVGPPGLSFYVSDPVQGLGKSMREDLERIGLPHELVRELDSFWKSMHILRELRELLADYFSLCLGFAGDVHAFKDAGQRTLADFFDGGSQTYLRCLQAESRLRTAAAEVLLTIEQGSPSDLFEIKSDQILQLIENQACGHINMDQVKKRRDSIRSAVRALEILSRLKSFNAFLCGIEACASRKTFHGEAIGDSMLEDMRTFLRRKDTVSLEENFMFLDALWFKLLRRREARHLLLPSAEK